MIPRFPGIRRFLADQRGLVAVEWLALAGAVVVGGVAVAYAVSSQLGSPATAIGTNMSTCDATGPAPAGCN